MPDVLLPLRPAGGSGGPGPDDAVALALDLLTRLCRLRPDPLRVAVRVNGLRATLTVRTDAVAVDDDILPACLTGLDRCATEAATKRWLPSADLAQLAGHPYGGYWRGRVRRLVAGGYLERHPHTKHLRRGPTPLPPEAEGGRA